MLDTRIVTNRSIHSNCFRPHDQTGHLYGEQLESIGTVRHKSMLARYWTTKAEKESLPVLKVLERAVICGTLANWTCATGVCYSFKFIVSFPLE